VGDPTEFLDAAAFKPFSKVIAAIQDVDKVGRCRLTHIDPGLTHIDPGLTHIHPGLTHIHPGLTHVEPGLTHIDPGLTHIDPVLTALGFSA